MSAYWCNELVLFINIVNASLLVPFLGVLTLLGKATICFVISVCPSLRMELLGSHWISEDLVFDYSNFVEEFQDPFKSDKKGHFTCSLPLSFSLSLPNGATAQGGPRPPLGVSSILPGLGRLLSNFYILALLHLPPLHLPNAVWISLRGAFLLAHWEELSWIDHHHPGVWHVLPTLHANLRKFMTISRWNITRIKLLSDESCREDKTYILWTIHFFFRK
jgi:hypothetical protein